MALMAPTPRPAMNWEGKREVESTRQFRSTFFPTLTLNRTHSTDDDLRNGPLSSSLNGDSDGEDSRPDEDRSFLEERTGQRKRARSR